MHFLWGYLCWIGFSFLGDKSLGFVKSLGVLVLCSALKMSWFFAGMPICEAFAQIEQQPNIYDVVHVKYFDEVWIVGDSYHACNYTYKHIWITLKICC